MLEMPADSMVTPPESMELSPMLKLDDDTATGPCTRSVLL